MKTGNGREYTLYAELGLASACECWKDYILFMSLFLFKYIKLFGFSGNSVCPIYSEN